MTLKQSNRIKLVSNVLHVISKSNIGAEKRGKKATCGIHRMQIQFLEAYFTARYIFTVSDYSVTEADVYHFQTCQTLIYFCATS